MHTTRLISGIAGSPFYGWFLFRAGSAPALFFYPPLLRPPLACKKLRRMRENRTQRKEGHVQNFYLRFYRQRGPGQALQMRLQG